MSSKKSMGAGIDALIPDEPSTPQPTTEKKTVKPARAKQERINKTFPFYVSVAEKLDALAWLDRKEKSQLLMHILEAYFQQWEAGHKKKIQDIVDDPAFIEYTEHQKAKRQK